MIIKPFRPEHLRDLLLQPSQALMQSYMGDPGYAKMLFQAGPAYSAFVNDKVVACLGIIPMWPGRAHAWGLVAAEAGTSFYAIHRAVKRFLDLQDYQRIEAAVVTSFEQGHRWIELLGFKREGTMTAYSPDGKDCDLYARIKWIQQH